MPSGANMRMNAWEKFRGKVKFVSGFWRTGCFNSWLKNNGESSPYSNSNIKSLNHEVHEEHEENEEI